MNAEDWRRMARVLRAGEKKRLYTEVSTLPDDPLAQALDSMANECDTIATELENPPTPKISCWKCKKLQPGPGFLWRDKNDVMRRLCADCAPII